MRHTFSPALDVDVFNAELKIPYEQLWNFPSFIKIFLIKQLFRRGGNRNRVIKNCYCCYALIIFSSQNVILETHNLMYKKLTFLFVFLMSFFPARGFSIIPGVTRIEKW